MSDWRRGWDSNPRTPVKMLLEFQSSAFDRSATSPAGRARSLHGRSRPGNEPPRSPPSWKTTPASRILPRPRPRCESLQRRQRQANPRRDQPQPLHGPLDRDRVRLDEHRQVQRHRCAVRCAAAWSNRPASAAAQISCIARGTTLAVTEITPRAPTLHQLGRRRVVAAHQQEAGPGSDAGSSRARDRSPVASLMPAIRGCFDSRATVSGSRSHAVRAGTL